MLGRKNYKREELDQCKEAIHKQLAAYKKLVKAIDGTTLVLDRYFVHRLRMVTGKDSNPLNEVELLSDSLMNNREFSAEQGDQVRP